MITEWEWERRNGYKSDFRRSNETWCHIYASMDSFSHFGGHILYTYAFYFKYDE